MMLHAMSSADDIAEAADLLQQQATDGKNPPVQHIDLSAPGTNHNNNNPQQQQVDDTAIITTVASAPLSAHPSGIDPPGIIYVALQEKKEPSSINKTSRNRSAHGSHSYIIRFYFVDTKGNLHHCVTGEDTGDSHYQYTSEEGFPPLFCHNKQEVKTWANDIMLQSQQEAGYTTDVVQDVVPADVSKVTLPTFVSYSKVREELPDGRHRIKWYLLDTQGHNHLAITGEEKETRDGHYAYHTESIFDYAKHLESGNQDDVVQWLESMLVPHETVPAPPRSRSKASARATATTPASLFAQTTGTPSTGFGTPLAWQPLSAGTRSKSGGGRRGRGRGRGRGPGRPPRPDGLGGRYITHSAGRHTSTGGRRGRTAWKVVDHDRDARELIAAELRRWALEEAQRREFSKTEALSYAQSELTTDEVATVKRCLPVLESIANDSNGSRLPGKGQSGTVAQKNALIDALSALREISHMRASASLASYPGLRSALISITKHKNEEVASLASSTLEQWLRAAIGQIHVLSDERYVRDPRPALDAFISDYSRFDPVVTAITHRTLAPPKHATGAGGAGSSLQHRTALATAVSTAFASTPSDSAFATITTDNDDDINITDMDDGDGGDGEIELEEQHDTMDLDVAPSAQLMDGSAGGAVMGDEGAEILPPYEQELAKEGVEF